VGTIMVRLAPAPAFACDADIPVLVVEGVAAALFAALAEALVRPVGLRVSGCGPSGVVPADTVGSVEVGRPDSGEIPGRAGAALIPDGCALASRVSPPARLVLVFRSSTERFGKVDDMSAAPGAGSAPILLPPAEPGTAGLPALPVMVEPVELVEAPAALLPPVLFAAPEPAPAAPLAPDVCATVVPSAALHNAVKVRKVLVFMVGR
jgi:hypothetical protein